MKAFPLYCITTFSFITSTTIFSMEQQTKAAYYQQECKRISEQHENEMQQLLDQKYTNPGAKIQKMESILDFYKKEAQKRETESFLAIKTRYAINDDLWGNCIKIAQELCILDNNNQHLPLPNVIHDTLTIPEGFYNMLTKELAEHNINALRFNIRCCNQLSQSGSTAQIQDWSDATITDEKIIIPGTIFIQSTDFITSLPDNIKKALCMHITELISGAWGNIIAALRSCANLFDPSGTFATSPELNFFNTQKSALASIRLSLRNQFNALQMKLYHQHVYSPRFALEDYSQVSKIECCHRALEELNKQYASEKNAVDECKVQ